MKNENESAAVHMLAKDHVLSENLSTWLGRGLVEARQGAPRITVTEHVKAEWARFAAACYKSGRNGLGHRFSSLAALPAGFAMAPREYDKAQGDYRAWLVFNEFPLVPGESWGDYAKRVAALEAEGLSTSDAQAVADVERARSLEGGGA